MNDLIERLQDESDLCRNDGANDIADLLDKAVKEIERLNKVVKDARELANKAMSYPYIRVWAQTWLSDNPEEQK